MITDHRKGGFLMEMDRVAIDTRTKRIRRHGAWLALLCAWGCAHAQVTPAPHVRSLAATCAACHGTEGRPVEGQPMPALAGLPRERIATELHAFRDGSRPATVMQQLAKGYSDAQIDALAAYFAALPAGSAR
jgi:sulfide dehydrogenase cytochrome subunit